MDNLEYQANIIENKYPSKWTFVIFYHAKIRVLMWYCARARDILSYLVATYRGRAIPEERTRDAPDLLWRASFTHEWDCILSFIHSCHCTMRRPLPHFQRIHLNHWIMHMCGLPLYSVWSHTDCCVCTWMHIQGLWPHRYTKLPKYKACVYSHITEVSTTSLTKEAQHVPTHEAF